MNTPNKLTSTRKYLITRILGITSLVLIVILMCVIYLVETTVKSILEDNTTDWAYTLAQASVEHLVDNKKDSSKQLKLKLTQLVTPPYINYIHIYEKKSDDTVTYFTGFNKNIYYPSIPDKIDQITLLSSLKHQQNILELIVPIERNKKNHGYLYIQSSTEYISNSVRELIYIAALFVLVGLIITLILVLAIQKRMNTPVSTIIETIQEITQSKNYHTRIATLPIIELDILGRNINILLKRTESHIQKQQEKHQQTLSQNSTLAAKVQARTDALKESNQDLLSTLEKLHQFQSQLVETEKMASLGDMVAGIAHEVNTPIGLGVTASTLMSDRLAEIKQAFEDKSLKSSQLKKFLIQGEENVAIIYRNLERAAKLISSFKKVAVDQSSADIREFNVKELLDEVLLTLKGKLDTASVDITINCPETLIVESKPGPINQIVINLVLNSILHGFEGKPNGQITISVIHLSNQLHLSYKDDGIGINEDIKEKVFEPFTTTKRGSGGSGLGLHLVYNLVTQALNGHIDFESSIEYGTTFNITFPIFMVSEQ